MRILILFLFIGLMNVHSFSQKVDTLYLFPDTTTFINTGITVIEDVANQAVEFLPPYNWNNYVLDKILIQFFFYDSTQILNELAFNISTGIIPENLILYQNKIIPDKFYPNWQEINIEPKISLKNLENLYVSGIFMSTARSDYLEEVIPYHFVYLQSKNEWREGTPCYFAVKIIIKNSITSSVKEEGIVSNFYLYQNYPNPFNSSTKINFIVTKAGIVQLNIFDILGKEHIQLINEYKTRGEYSIDFNPQDLNSGYYFYNLIFNGISVTKKMIYLK